MRNSEDLFQNLLSILKALTDEHLKLSVLVAEERQVLVDANLPSIQEKTIQKQRILEIIQKLETRRVKLIAELAIVLKKPFSELTLIHLVEIAGRQNNELGLSLKTVLHDLKMVIHKVTEQNQDNQNFIQNSLNHIREMKRNVLMESSGKSNLYSPKGCKIQPSQPPTMISKEV